MRKIYKANKSYARSKNKNRIYDKKINAFHFFVRDGGDVHLISYKIIYGNNLHRKIILFYFLLISYH